MQNRRDERPVGSAVGGSTVQEMRPALIVSGVVHFVILLLIIFGLPLMPQKKLELTEPIAVTMVAPPSDQARTTKVDNPTPKPDITPVEQKAPEPPKPPPPPTPPPPPPEPPAEKLPELKPIDQQLAQVQPMEALPELAKPMQIVKPKPAPPKPVPPPVTPPKKTQADQQAFDSLLANLTPAVPKADELAKTPVKQSGAPPAQRSNLSNQLTADELNRVSEQLKGCWNMPIGAMSEENLKIHIVGEFNPDRTLRGETLVDTEDRYNKDPYYRAAADSAMRALRNPRCNPLDLPPNKYDEWRSLQMDFDPKEMLVP
jgi:type IV secretory pathway VirB10-like protein